MAYASGYFKTRYADEFYLLETRTRKVVFVVFLAALLIFPFFASPFGLDLANQVFLALIGCVALMLLTGFAGSDIARTCRIPCGRSLHHRHTLQGSKCPYLGDFAGLRSCRRAPRSYLRISLAAVEGSISGAQYHVAPFHCYVLRRRIPDAQGLRDRRGARCTQNRPIRYTGSRESGI